MEPQPEPQLASLPMAPPTDIGSCGYLVIGAGAASLAFVDSIAVEQPKAKAVIVCGQAHRAPAAPGGHWNDACDFVHLHQPSLVYGVQTKRLEGNWARLALRRMLP